MGKHESIESKDQATPAPAADACVATTAADTPRMALASIDIPKGEGDIRNGDIAKIDVAKSETPRIESPSIASSGAEPLKAEPPSFEQLSLDMPSVDAIGTAVAPADVEPPAAAARDAAAESPPIDGTAARGRFPLLAASLAVAAALGALAGGLAATSLVRSTPAPAITTAKTGLEEVQALKEQIVQVRVDLAALKASIDAGHRSANAQFTRINERVERIDRTQAEPVAKLTKAIEAFERRGDPAKEATGSITPPHPVAGQPPKQPGIVEGWILRDVERGTALIEGRMGMIEVDTGDVVPGLGRIEAIRKQDGRWVVVTSRGLIVAPQR
jgi:hypothetical protein